MKYITRHTDSNIQIINSQVLQQRDNKIVTSIVPLRNNSMKCMTNRSDEKENMTLLGIRHLASIARIVVRCNKIDTVIIKFLFSSTTYNREMKFYMLYVNDKILRSKIIGIFYDIPETTIFFLNTFTHAKSYVFTLRSYCPQFTVTILTTDHSFYN